MHQLVGNVVVVGHVPFTKHECAHEQNWITQHVYQTNLDYLLVESELAFLELTFSIRVEVKVYAHQYEFGE